MNYKNFSTELLNDIFGEENFGEYFPLHHQLVSMAFTIGQDLNYTYYWNGVGTGKTLTALWTAMLWRCKKILVISPISAFIGWERDIRKTDFLYERIYGKTEDRIEKLGIDSDIYLTNYEGLKLLYGKKVKVSDKKYKWVVDYDSFVDGFDCIIFDELHRLINCKSIQYKIALELSMLADFRIGLSGTPFGGDFGEFFNQVRLLDRGKSFGHSEYMFKNIYYNKYGFNYVLKPNSKDKILNKISDFTIHYDKDECYDLPPVTEISKWVVPTDEQRKLEKEIIEKIFIDLAEGRLNLTYPIVKSSKLIQIMNGFVYVGTGDDRKVKYLKNNPKADEIEDLLKQITGQVVIFYKFKEELKYLEEICNRNNFGYEILTGSLKNKTKAYNSFVNNPDIKCIFGHPKSASESFEFVNSQYMIFTTPISSVKLKKQCIGRIDRGTQKKKCFVFEFICEKTLEEIVYYNSGNNNKTVTEAERYVKNYG